MRPELKYIELKSGFEDNGPAWIGMSEFSKSGRTVYFNGKALKNLNAQGISGNYYDMETGDEYWISGIKKDGTDRHWAGGGKIMIDRSVVDLYLSLVDFDVLEKIDLNSLTFYQPINKNLRIWKMKNLNKNVPQLQL